jgi:hypothetical protein
VNGTTKSYTLNGNTRSEANIVIGTMPNPMNTVSLTMQGNPGIVYTLDEQHKTYSEMSVAGRDKENEDYEVTVLGKEKAGVYNATHVKVMDKRTQKVTEMWLSKDIPNYASFASVKTKYLGGEKLFAQLKDKGADGYAVRILMNDERTGQIELALVKAERRNIDESMLSLDGYTKGTSAAPGKPGGIDPEQIKNMTPEERQKFIQDMKAKYQH